MAGVQQDMGAVRRQRALDQYFDAPAAVLFAVQARLDHPRVVEHEHVAGVESLDQVGDEPIVAAALADVQQTRGLALFGRMLGDQLWREVKFEIRASCFGHGRRLAAVFGSILGRTRGHG
ncbi:hypothetical protein SBBP2_760018 [Burkholderiales bacterium]|nr:hypothetical protein SBBP2_760018 [Burkholderiales bacterium]